MAEHGPRVWTTGDVRRLGEARFHGIPDGLTHLEKLLRLMEFVDSFYVANTKAPLSQPRDEFGRFLPRPRLEAVK